MKKLLTVMVVASAIASAAQTNGNTNAVATKAAPPTTNVFRPYVPPASDPLTPIRAGIAGREQKLAALEKQMTELRQRESERAARYALAQSINHNAAAARAEGPTRDRAERQAAALQRQCAQLKLEIADLRERYKLPAPEKKHGKIIVNRPTRK